MSNVPRAVNQALWRYGAEIEGRRGAHGESSSESGGATRPLSNAEGPARAQKKRSVEHSDYYGEEDIGVPRR